MTNEEAMALFAMAKGRAMTVTIAGPDGSLRHSDVPCEVRPAINNGDSPAAAVTIVPTNTDAGYYTTFPVETAKADADGNLVVTGPDGTATFRTAGG